ncbi:MAG: iron-sulfur cluster assembly accessory protein [Pseudohongiellaceae bacterium]
MSVESFDPTKIDLSISDEAAEHFRRQLQKDPDAQTVRLSVRESGCTGYMYVVDMVGGDNINERDLKVPVGHGLELRVDPDSLGIINGTKIDLVTEGVNRQLRFLNPNALDHCGCGESFNIASD